MGRPQRTAQGGRVYHVLNRANARMQIFRKDADYAAFEQAMAEVHERLPMRVLAWCLMPNHWHLVLWPRNDGDLTGYLPISPGPHFSGSPFPLSPFPSARQEQRPRAIQEQLPGGAMKASIYSIFFSIVITTANVAALDVVQAREPAKATDRLTAPLDTIEPTAPGSHTYQLAISKDEKLCGRMLKLFNDDLAKYGYEQYGEHEEFNKIPWKDIRLSYESDSQGRIEYIPAKGALFDINNDGVKEFVVRWESKAGKLPRDALNMLESDAAKRAEKLTFKEVFDSKNKVHTEGWSYLLATDPDSKAARELEKSWENFSVLRPFLFHDKAYLYMKPGFDPSVSVSDVEPTYSVVARYLGGPINIDNPYYGKMDNLCFFKRIRTDKRLPN